MIIFYSNYFEWLLFFKLFRLVWRRSLSIARSLFWLTGHCYWTREGYFSLICRFSPTLSSHLKSVGTLVNPKFLGQPLQFLVLGQKGLLPGRGISDVQVFNASPPLDQSGCVPALASSLGNEVDHDFVNSNPGYLVSGEFKIGSVLPNCGMPKPCDGEMLPVHLYTGRDHNDPPKLCINGI